MVWRQSWRTNSWILATVSGVVPLLGLPGCSSLSTDVRLVLNRACHWNTCARLKLWSPKACWIIVRVFVALFPRLAQNLMHTCCFFLWSIVKIATGHVHDYKHVKTPHVHPAICSLAHWLTRHGSPTMYRCFALPQLLYRWRHQSGKFWIPPCIWMEVTVVGLALLFHDVELCVWYYCTVGFDSSIVLLKIFLILLVQICNRSSVL